MSSHPPLIFNNISPDQYAKLSEKARAAGIELSGDRGTASKFGVQIAWNYSAETQQLTLQCIKTPVFVSAADVHTRIQKLVQETLPSA